MSVGDHPWWNSSGNVATISGTCNTTGIPVIATWTPNVPGSYTITVPFISSGYSSPEPKEQVVPNWKPKSHLVIRHGGAVVESHDSLEDAVDAAKRLAAKEEEHFYVFSPSKVVKPKSVDVEVTEA